jgi:hypothetical protein
MCGSGRGDVSSITVAMLIVGAGSRTAAFKESGVLVASDMFSISVSGLLRPRVDRPVAGDGGGGMYKGGGEFSWFGEGVIPVDPSCGIGDSAGVCDIVKGVGVCVGWIGFGSVVESGRHTWTSSRERVFILLVWL